jgi:predicted enzyme related to lactoylglutathione lyase
MSIVTSHPPGAFCWVELATTDQNAAKAFYGSLFDWKFNDIDMGPGGAYTIFTLKDHDVAAGYTLDPQEMPGVPPHWMLYVATADADAAALRCTELGGAVVMPGFDVFDKGRMAVLKDPTGGIHNIWQAKGGSGTGIYNEPGAFCWGQLNTSDTAEAERYYTAMFGWGAKTSSGGDMTYTEWTLGGNPLGGMMALPPGTPAPSHWLAYFAVEDCDASAAKAVSLGATQCVPPTDITGTGRFAVFTDPQGAFFAIYKD